MFEAGMQAKGLLLNCSGLTATWVFLCLEFITPWNPAESGWRRSKCVSYFGPPSELWWHKIERNYWLQLDVRAPTVALHS